jgi:ADP-heptose:LPS heptosyltransferase
MTAKKISKMELVDMENTTVSKESRSTIAIVQLTRFGDIVQTIHSVREFRKEFPEIRLVFIARKRFAAPFRWILDDLFDQCYLLDFHKMINLPQGKNPKLDTVIERLDQFVTQINTEEIDVLLNLSFSKSSATLCGLINAQSKLGMHNCPQSLALNIQDHWSQHVYSSVMRGSLSPFSLVDVYRRMLGGFKPETNSTAKKIQSLEGEEQVLTIHPFASDPKKRWDGHKWTEIIYQVLNKHPNTSIVVVGSYDEQSAANDIVEVPLLDRYRHRISNLAGKTTIRELFSLVKESSLFLGHDSMVSHVAAYNGCPSITISLGTVRPHETAPYGANNYVLAPKTKCFPCFPQDSCPLFKCHTDVPFQVVHSAVNAYLNHGKITKKLLSKSSSRFHLDTIRCYQSRFMDTGMYQLTDVLNDNLALTDFFRLLYRVSWLYFFTSEEETHDIPPLTQEAIGQLPHYRKGLQQLFELCEFGKKYSRYILEEIGSKTPNLANIKIHSERIDEIDSLAKVLHQCYPHMAPLLDYLAVQKGNLRGNNIVELTESTYMVYSDCSAMTSLIYDLIKNSEEKTTGKRKIPQQEV